MTAVSANSWKFTARSLLPAILALAWLSSAAADDTITVRLLAGRDIAVVAVAAPGQLFGDAQGRSTPADDCRITLKGDGRGVRCGDDALHAPPFRLTTSEAGAANGFVLRIAGENRHYPGALTVLAKPGNDELELRVTCSTNDYVAAVLSAETLSDEPEYLKAMALVVRAHARHEASSSGTVADDTRSQTFRGLPKNKRAARLRDIAATMAGREIRVDGRPAPAFYHACCGGHTRAARDVWPRLDDWPHLRGVADHDDQGRAWCRESRWFSWSRRLARDAWQGFLSSRYRATAARRGKEDGAFVLTPSAGGSEPTVGGWAFRLALGRALGWNSAPSDRFTLTADDGGVTLAGRGFGHRVGLCQSGALAQARSGRTAEQIMAFYFPGAAIH